MTRGRPEIGELCQKLVAGEFLPAHQIEDAAGSLIGLHTIPSDVMQSAPDIQGPAHDIDIIR
ncbi:hypothetical protein J2Z50_004182 [Ensifer mexicanus]|nr:hypothetical protein [Sinorhizobium mexicanum]